MCTSVPRGASKEACPICRLPVIGIPTAFSERSSPERTSWRSRTAGGDCFRSSAARSRSCARVWAHEEPMTINRKIAGLLALACSICCTAALAQYPSRPARMLVGFTPGGGVDINGRLLASKLTEYLGQQFVVENRPGAGTNIANELVAKAAPDGYTLLFNSPAVAINMSLYKNPPYDALRDFAGVSVFSESTNILVVPISLPAKSVQELVALARDKPGALNYSSAGAGSIQHLAPYTVKLRTGTDIVHGPYKSSPPSIAALIAAEVQLSFLNSA